jgi:hypothetical protein
MTDCKQFSYEKCSNKKYIALMLVWPLYAFLASLYAFLASLYVSIVDRVGHTKRHTRAIQEPENGIQEAYKGIQVGGACRENAHFPRDPRHIHTSRGAKCPNKEGRAGWLE